VYVAGYENNANGSQGNKVAKIWINGKGIEITDGTKSAYLTAISVIKSDVYVLGVEFENNQYVGKMWKNGVSTILSQGIYPVVPNSLYVNSKALYVVGNQIEENNITTALVWKNGNLDLELVNGSQANSVFVGD